MWRLDACLATLGNHLTVTCGWLSGDAKSSFGVLVDHLDSETGQQRNDVVGGAIRQKDGKTCLRAHVPSIIHQLADGHANVLSRRGRLCLDQKILLTVEGIGYKALAGRHDS